MEYFGNNVIGYKKIPGKTLKREIFDNLNNEKQKIIANQLGLFLRELHQTKCEKREIPEYRNFFNKKGFLELIPRIEKFIFPKIPKETRENICKFLDHFEKNEKNFISDKGSTHGDLDINNIIWNSETEKLGIIDFGDIAKDSIIKDFTLLGDFSFKNDNLFLENILETYNSRDKDLFRKIKEFSKLEKLYWPIEDIEDHEIGITNNKDFKDSLEMNLKAVNNVFKINYI